METLDRETQTNVAGPRGAANYIRMPIESFRLFFTDEMDDIIGYTNDVIRPVLQRFSHVLEASTKYTHFHLLITWTYGLS